jgi:hypothetical protein
MIFFLFGQIRPKQKNTNLALYVNFKTLTVYQLNDTCPSVGAGDNAVSCSVMLEIIRILSMSSIKLKHNVIFLFNGAEENMLQVYDLMGGTHLVFSPSEI